MEVVTDLAACPAPANGSAVTIGAFDGVPGDTKSGNGNYDLPPETVNTGQISIH